MMEKNKELTEEISRHKELIEQSRPWGRHDFINPIDAEESVGGDDGQPDPTDNFSKNGEVLKNQINEMISKLEEMLNEYNSSEELQRNFTIESEELMAKGAEFLKIMNYTFGGNEDEVWNRNDDQQTNTDTTPGDSPGVSISPALQ